MNNRQLNPEVLKAVRDLPIKMEIAQNCGVTVRTVWNWIQNNSHKLCMYESLVVIKRHVVLTKGNYIHYKPTNAVRV